VYDPDLFQRHRLYSIAVRKSSHPGLVEYVQNLTHSLKASLNAWLHVLKQSVHSMLSGNSHSGEIAG